MITTQPTIDLIAVKRRQQATCGMPRANTTPFHTVWDRLRNCDDTLLRFGELCNFQCG
jgi:hypothetical protein